MTLTLPAFTPTRPMSPPGLKQSVTDLEAAATAVATAVIADETAAATLSSTVTTQGTAITTLNAKVAALQTFASAHLAADVTMTLANTFYDGPSVSLAAGTWELVGSVNLFDTAGGAGLTVKLWDGLTAFDAGFANIPVANQGTRMTCQAIVTPGGTTTYKLSVASNTTASALKANPVLNSPGGNLGCTLIARRIA